MAVIVLIHVVFVSIWVGSLVLLCAICAERVATGKIEDVRLNTLTLRVFALYTTLPAVLAVLAGTWAAFARDFDGGWLPSKLAFVALLAALHVYVGRLVAQLRDRIPQRPWHYLAVAAAALLIALPILYLVLGKPF